MKYRTNITVALTSLAIFLALAVAGGICIAAGFADYAKNSGFIDSAKDIFEYVEDYSVDFSVSETEHAEADYVRQLGSEVERITVTTGGCSVDVRNGSEFSVIFSGKVNAGKFGNPGQNDSNAAIFADDVSASDISSSSDVSSASDIISAADAADYFFNDGIINARFIDGVLEINVESEKNISIVYFGTADPLGHVTVTIPDFYTGSLELKDCFAELTVAGLDFDELALSSCMGEIEISNCSANQFTITNMAGETDAEDCRFAAVYFDDIAGEINVDSRCGLTSDSLISDIAGEVNIELPAGSQLNVTRDAVLGDVRIDRSITDGEGAATLEIISVMGEVSVDAND